MSKSTHITLHQLYDEMAARKRRKERRAAILYCILSFLLLLLWFNHIPQ